MEMQAAQAVQAWYAVYCRSGAEKDAADAIKRLGYAVFFPRKLVRQRRHRPGSTACFPPAWVEAPYFRNYIFVGCSADQIDSVYPINNTDGVCSVVYCNNEPLVIPEYEIARLMRQANEKGIIGRTEKGLIVGELVRFLDDDNPFLPFLARVALDGTKEVSLTLKILGAERRIIVPSESIAPVA